MSYFLALKRFATGNPIALALSAAIIASVIILAFQKSLTQALISTFETKSQPLTELYFDNPSELPKEIFAGEPAKFSYTIVNRDSADKSYRIHVSQVTNGKIRSLDDELVTISGGRALTLTQLFDTSADSQQLELIVDLPDLGQNIHFQSKS